MTEHGRRTLGCDRAGHSRSRCPEGSPGDTSHEPSGTPKERGGGRLEGCPGTVCVRSSGVRCCLVSLIISDVEHFIMDLLAIHRSSLENVLCALLNRAHAPAEWEAPPRPLPGLRGARTLDHQPTCLGEAPGVSLQQSMLAPPRGGGSESAGQEPFPPEGPGVPAGHGAEAPPSLFKSISCTERQILVFPLLEHQNCPWVAVFPPPKAVSTQRPTHLARHSTMRDGDPFWGGAGLIFAKQEHLHQNRVPRGTCGLVLQTFCYLFRHTCPIWSPHTRMHAHPTYMHRTHTHRYTCTVQGTHSGTLGRTRTHTRAEARDQCCEPCGGDITAH